MTVHVHVENARLFPEEVIVQGGHVETIVEKRRHHGIDFVLSQDEIAHHDVHAASPFVSATQPPKPNGVGVFTPATVT